MSPTEALVNWSLDLGILNGDWLLEKVLERGAQALEKCTKHVVLF
jgi:hypothetical protein